MCLDSEMPHNKVARDIFMQLLATFSEMPGFQKLEHFCLKHNCICVPVLLESSAYAQSSIMHNKMITSSSCYKHVKRFSFIGEMSLTA